MQKRRAVGYALSGMLLGVMAPVGWALLRLLLFGDDQRGLLTQIHADLLLTPALYLYMGFGTTIVLGVCGFLIGRTTQMIDDRAHKLDRLHREVETQKIDFERRFTDLNSSIKNFHLINTDLQRSVRRDEIFNLVATGLHDVIGYDRVNILLDDEGANCLHFAVCYPREGATQSLPSLPRDQRAGALYRVMRDGQGLLISDIGQLPADMRLQPPFDRLPQLRSRSFVLCPILVRGRAVGLVSVDNKTSRRPLAETDVDTVKLFADQVASALTRVNLLDAVERLTVELEQTFAQVLGYRQEHETLIGSLRTTVRSTSAATGDISRGAAVIQDAVDTTASAVTEISGSIEQVAGNMRTLNGFVEQSMAATSEIRATVAAVEERSVNSHGMAEKVRNRAEHGVKTVGDLLGRLRGIATSVEQSEQIIRQLSARGEEIGSITTVVAGLTQKTSLLALNASIIAAQAGEHGRSFAVVANEVRNLAQEAAASTEKIEAIIDEIARFIHRNVEHIAHTNTLVNEGLSEGDEMSGVLDGILDSSSQAMHMAHEISVSTREITRAVAGVSRAVEDLGGMSAQVTQATREELNGAKNIVSAVESVRTMAEEMVRATAQQSSNAGEIDRFVDQVSSMAHRIFTEVEERRTESDAVLDDLQQLKQGG
ncbi:MAG: methyl-accepting chemotaxis protein [Desulfuromonadales bacterium]|nr:methyl-accepting chemotaxis protein [Desulfuromonadales bacterium]